MRRVAGYPGNKPDVTQFAQMVDELLARFVAPARLSTRLPEQPTVPVPPRCRGPRTAAGVHQRKLLSQWTAMSPGAREPGDLQPGEAVRRYLRALSYALHTVPATPESTC